MQFVHEYKSVQGRPIVDSSSTLYVCVWRYSLVAIKPSPDESMLNYFSGATLDISSFSEVAALFWSPSDLIVTITNVLYLKKALLASNFNIEKK